MFEDSCPILLGEMTWERFFNGMQFIVALAAIGFVVYKIHVSQIAAERSKKEEAERQREAFYRQSQIDFEKLLGLFDELKASPISVPIQNQIYDLVARYPLFGKDSYQISLEMIGVSKGDPVAKQFALKIGRQYLGSLRETGQPTVYDEQAIQNDIAAQI